jgi:hypothetical protein
MTATGNPSADVGHLCGNVKPDGTKAGINMWAKYKPVKHNVLFNEQLSTWWRAYNYSCGIIIPSAATLSQILQMFRSGQEMWTYDPPTAGWPYRLGDFKNYKHTAYPPFAVTEMADVYYQYSADSVIGAAMDMTVPDEYTLALSDIADVTNLDSMYYAIAICRQNATTAQYVTEAVTIAGGGGGGVGIPVSQIYPLSNGANYEVVQMLAQSAKTSLTAADVPNKFIPLPGGYHIIKIVTSTVQITLSATRTGGTISWTLTINNVSNENIMLTNCRMLAVYGDWVTGGTLEAGELMSVLENINAVKGVTTTRTGTFTNALPDYDTRSGRVVFEQSTNPAWNVDTEFEQEA